MMRSLFSGVSGLRVHQTKMDVIGNNIANVNTVGYKSSRVTFNEVFSQTVGGASSANPDTGRGGINPMQIGLGVNVASIDKLMTTGASQRTDNPFDLMIQGEGFFIVGDGSGTYFTRAGALNLDAAGNLVTSSGLMVMGWDTNAEGTEISRGIVKPIQITGEKEYITPNLTSQIDFKGNLNAATNTATAKIMSQTFYDSVGNSYVVDSKMQYVPSQPTQYYTVAEEDKPADGAIPEIKVGDLLDKDGMPIARIATADDTADPSTYKKGDYITLEATPTKVDPTDGDWLGDLDPISAATDGYWTYELIPVAYPNGKRDQGVMIVVDPDDGSIEFTQVKAEDQANHDPVMVGILTFDTNGLPTRFIPANATDDPDKFPVDKETGDFPAYTDSPNSKPVDGKVNQFVLTIKTGTPNELIPAADFGKLVSTPGAPAGLKDSIIIDFSALTQFGNETSNATSSPKDGNGPGTLTGMSIGSDGVVMGRYSNGQTKILGQIPVAVFKNPAGLEKAGDNLFVTTANSGGFDGIGQEITTGGGAMLGGVLEMSNVDLSQEFTEMITTQRGFQANSRVITTSDDMLQELVNLKR